MPTSTTRSARRTTRPTARAAKRAGATRRAAKPGVAAPFTLHLTAELAAARAHVPFLRRMIKKARPLVGGEVCEFCVALVGDARMSQLHEDFMAIPGPTDVLTFELDHDARGRVTAGEVVVDLHEAARQARSRQIPLQHELLLYCLHGLLHLSGYDDTSKAEHQRMHLREDEILSTLGLGPVFHRDREAGKRKRSSAHG